MNAKDAIRGTMDLSNHILKAYFDDLTDAELMQRPGPGCNPLAWQLGHLISSEASLLNQVSPGTAPELPAGFVEQHSKATAGFDDASKFGTKQQYLDLLDQVRAATLSALDKLPEADLDKPGPEGMRKMCPTVGSFFNLIASHPLMHAGQFVPVRRALGKPIKI
ncbi:MAG: DinB family protein [Planctomycetes bacterium]|nr:DinB family protein [Planctomycetota bacterium]